MLLLDIDLKGLEMLSFREIELEDAEMILKWRMSSRVTKFMNTDVTFDLNAQTKWLSSCYGKEHYYHWIILNDNDPVGLINLADYSVVNNTTSWGYYLGEEGLNAYGAFIPPYFYNFLFNKLNINHINVEFFYNNTNVIGLHLLHGYKFSPSNDRVIVKNGKDILLVSMMLDKDNWNSKRFAKNIANFPVDKWRSKPNFLAHNIIT